MSAVTKMRLGYAGMIVVMLIGSTVVGTVTGVVYGATCRILMDSVLPDHGVNLGYTPFNPGNLGYWLGMISGILASLFFCWRIIVAHRSLTGWHLIWQGVVLGVLAGGCAAAMVHEGIAFILRFNPLWPHIGLLSPFLIVVILVGAIIGALMGAIGGRLADVPRPNTTAHPADAPAPIHAPGMA